VEIGVGVKTDARVQVGASSVVGASSRPDAKFMAVVVTEACRLTGLWRSEGGVVLSRLE